MKYRGRSVRIKSVICKDSDSYNASNHKGLENISTDLAVQGLAKSVLGRIWLASRL